MSDHVYMTTNPTGGSDAWDLRARGPAGPGGDVRSLLPRQGILCRRRRQRGRPRLHQPKRLNDESHNSLVADVAAFGDLHLVDDVSGADWIVASVRNFQHDVGSLLPVTFEAYARVLHPASRGNWGDTIDVPWSAVAAANGRIAHAAMEWVAITGDWKFEREAVQPGIWDQPPSEGSLPRAPPRASPACSPAHQHAIGMLVRRLGGIWRRAVSAGDGAADRDAAAQDGAASRSASCGGHRLRRHRMAGQREPVVAGRSKLCVATDIDLMST